MSKERLEEIQEKLIRWRTEERFNLIVDFWPKDVRDVEWLIEQSERVQELEGRKYRQELIDEHIERLEQQNKRYREALKTINESTDVIKDFKEHSYYAEETARKAMEDEE